MSISRTEWVDWLRSSVTQAVVAKLSEKRDEAVEAMLNAQGGSIEEIGLVHLAYRNKLEGLGEFLDLESLEEWICED